LLLVIESTAQSHLFKFRTISGCVKKEYSAALNQGENMTKKYVFMMLVLLIPAVFPLIAQMGTEKEPPEALIGLYRVAPGKHLEFLRWQAAQEAIRKEAGITAATQWYVHTNGDSWDYMAIAPVLTDEQNAKVDELTIKKGLKTGFKASLEFRQFITYHTDTFTAGPFSASDLVQQAEK
jgi:hypothetical protein